jgi:hypothetical protein
MSRFLAVAALSACLATPVAMVKAQDHFVAQDAMQKHQWNDQEDKHWHDYLKERHKKDHDWAKASKREQKEYWHWRDQHPDAP